MKTAVKYIFLLFSIIYIKMFVKHLILNIKFILMIYIIILFIFLDLTYLLEANK